MSMSNFPLVIDGKTQLNFFLESAKGLVVLVDDLGKLFAPLSYDMSNNIQKIEKGKCHLDNNANFLEDLLLAEKTLGEDFIANSVLWLKRALHFFAVFYQCLIDDPRGPESLENVMELAYKASLEPYHGWVTRTLFSFFKKACPARSVVLQMLRTRMNAEERVLERLQEYCTPLASVIQHIDCFYFTYGLDVNSKAP